MQFPLPRIDKFRKLTPLTLAFSALAFLAGNPATAAANSPSARIGSLAIPFVQNKGQLDARVAFYARTFAGTVFVTREGALVYSLAAPKSGKAAGGWVLSETFPGLKAHPAGERPAASRISHFSGRAGALADLPAFDAVALGELAPGIRAEVRATGSNIEKLFIVGPGADPALIRGRFAGAQHIELESDGSLSIGTGLGPLHFTAPVAYQDAAGGRKPVAARYVVTPEGDYGFSLGEYDSSLPLVIDPLIRSTYAGGGVVDTIRALAVHPGTGDVYAAGYTTSTDFPNTASGAQPANATGTTEALVARYNPGLTSLLRASYYGGDGADIANAIAIHPSTGDVYIAGTTSSNANTLLNIIGSFQGQTDGFIVRFNGALGTVLNARYYGGGGNDNITGIVVDKVSGDVVVAGETTSTNLTLGTPGSAQLSSGGGQDTFVARFTANLEGLTRASYFGGAGNDRALGVALDPITGDVIIGGATTSATGTLIGSSFGALSSYGGSTDGFVARFDSGLTAIRTSTYFGGSTFDAVTAVAVHPISGDVYAAGETTSLVLRGHSGGQPALGGGTDAFVVRFHPDLTGLQSYSYFGGLGDDIARAIAISKYSGEVYIAGDTTSATLPGTTQGVQEASANNCPTPATCGLEAFVARFDEALTGIRQSTFFGGAGTDIANAVGLTDSTAYIAGETSSALPGLTSAAQPASGGGTSDGFVAAMGSDLRVGNSSPLPFAFVPVTNALPGTVQVSAPALITPSGVAVGYIDGQPGSAWCASSAANCACDLTGGDFITSAAQLSTTAPSTYYACVRHTASAAPDTITTSRLHIGGISGSFRVATTGGGSALVRCSLDIDGNGAQDALTDGLMIIRALFGLTGGSVTNNAIGANAARSTWIEIRAFLNSNCGSNFP